jgi:hypothetical protein
MDNATIKDYANLLLDVYLNMIDEHADVVHDPEDHNICLAIVERPRTASQVYWSYSNPSSLRADFLRGPLANVLVPNVEPHNKIIAATGSRNDLHTEVRLLNYLHSIDLLSNNSTITLLSSRSVCGSCAQKIYDLQKKIADKCALVATELKAEKKRKGEANNITKIYVMSFKAEGPWERPDNPGSGRESRGIEFREWNLLQ